MSLWINNYKEGEGSNSYHGHALARTNRTQDTDQPWATTDDMAVVRGAYEKDCCFD